MVGHDDVGVEEKSSLTAVVEDGLLQQFGGGGNLEETAALGCYGGDEIGPGFLRRKSHLGRIDEKARG